MADSPPRFERVLETSLFVMPRGTDDAGWCGYLLKRGTRPPAGSLTIAEGLETYNGHFLFALSAPALGTGAEVERFELAVWEYLDNAFGGPRREFRGKACVWIPEARTPMFGPAGEYAFTYVEQQRGSVLGSDFNNPIGTRMTLSLPNGISIGATDSALRFSGRATLPIVLLTSPADAAPSIEPNAAQLPCVGPYSGCVSFHGSIDPPQTLTFFEAGVRYVHPDERSAPVHQVYPVLADADVPPLTYAGVIDPLDPTNAGPGVDHTTGQMRTLLAPLAAGEPPLPAGEPPAFAAWLRTSTGLATSLIPLGKLDDGGHPRAGSGAFVFESAGARGDAKADVYMSFAGDWALAVPGMAPTTHQILCGVDGLEQISCRSYGREVTYDRLRFIPGCCAYAPHFPFQDASVANPAGAKELLDDTYKTAWITVLSCDRSAVEYMAQPASGPLYRTAPAAEAQDPPTIFRWLRTGSEVPKQAAFAVPLAPYAGLEEARPGFPADELASFESEVLAPSRKALMSPSSLRRLRGQRAARLRRPSADAAQAPLSATTPQGYVVELDGPSYTKVTLARSPASPDLAFAGVTAELQNLLETNQLLAPIVNPRHVGTARQPASIATPTFQNQVTIAGWRLAAAIGHGCTASDYRNVAIFKFCEGTLRDRVVNPGKWSDPLEFSLLEGSSGDEDVGLSGLSQWLQEYLDAGIAEYAAGNQLYADFARLVSDPHWNGLLVLAADVVSLPEQVAGLMAGIDATRLTAHHFGAAVTPVTAGTQTPNVGLSSLFGLIDYQLPLYRENVAAGADPEVPLGLPVQGAYGFTVLQLQALFRNSALADLRSRIQLTVNELFGSPVLAAYGARGREPANGVVLRGSYQSQGGHDTYVFEQDVPTLFALQDEVLQAVTFDRVQWDTLGHTGSATDATLTSRVLIWGKLDFAALALNGSEPFDVLSFGSDPGTDLEHLGRGLAFANLKLELSSPAATPAATEFTFDASALAFDLASSFARDASLFEDLGLQLDSFIQAPAGRHPVDYGYLPVTSTLAVKSFEGPWYGVVYKLTLGGPGALVAKAGFESRLLLGWAANLGPPGAGADGAPTDLAGAGSMYEVFTGIALPGAAPGAKLLSLQGVLKLSVASIRLIRQAVAGHTGQMAFVLQLRNVGIKFLGIAKLPPGATINFFLFGALKGGGSLGWYAAYRKDAHSEQIVALDPTREHAELRR